MLGVFKKKGDLPEYLSHYGMHRAPFSSDIEDDMFYADPVRQQRLNVLLHLTQNTNELLVLIGEEGMGKTTFVDQFRKNAAEHWRLCFIEGHKMMTEEQFLQLVYKGFNIAHASTHKGTMLSNLRKRLEIMLEEAIPVILVIDDAQLFSTKVLALIIEIASVRNTKTGGSVRVIMAAEPQIKILLAEPELDDTHDLIIRKIDLPPLDESHTGDYLHHRLTQAGMKVEQFLTKATIHKIFKSSEGVPKKINDAADKLLFDTTPIIRRNSHIQSQQQSSGLKRLAIIIIIISILMGIGIFFYFYPRDQLFSANSPQLGGERTTTLILPPVEKFSANEKEPTEQVVDENADPMQSLKEQLAENSSPGQEDSSKQAESNTEKSTQAVKLATPGENTGTNSGLKDNAWVMAQNADHYTLQLVAGRQKQTITKFIKKYQLKDDLIYFSSKRNDKIWHNLSHGIYPERNSANQAAKKLPTSLATVKPWIRKIGAIQAEIRKLGDK